MTDKIVSEKLLGFYEKIKIPENDMTEYKRMVVQAVTDGVIPKMKEESALYKELSTAFHWTGSVYDNLVIRKNRGKMDFDVNIKLKLPVNYDLIKMETHATNSRIPVGYVALKLPDVSQIGENKPVLKDFSKYFASDGYLDPDKILKWQQSVMDKATKKVQLTGLSLASLNESGPAWTVKIQNSRGLSIDVDLVLVIEFEPRYWPAHMSHGVISYRREAEQTPFMCIPKRTSSHPYAWRLSFAQGEQKLIKGYGSWILAIKLVKNVRDKHNMSEICSYHIKTAAMWVMEQWNVDPGRREEYQKVTFLGRQFIAILRCLADSLDRGHLPFYWDPSANMFEKISRVSCDNHRDRIRRIVRSIDRNPENIEQFFDLK